MEARPGTKQTCTYYLFAKLCVHIILFIVFLFFFGFPSFNRYQAKGVLIKTEQRSQDGFELPGVTICPRYSERFPPWTDVCRPGAPKPLAGAMAALTLHSGTLCDTSAGTSPTRTPGDVSSRQLTTSQNWWRTPG